MSAPRDLLPGRLRELSRLCREIVPLGFCVLSDHAERLPREMVAELRAVLTRLRRLDEDCRDRPAK
jgi:hypothetical protein